MFCKRSLMLNRLHQILLAQNINWQLDTGHCPVDCCVRTGCCDDSSFFSPRFHRRRMIVVLQSLLCLVFFDFLSYATSSDQYLQGLYADDFSKVRTWCSRMFERGNIIHLFVCSIMFRMMAGRTDTIEPDRASRATSPSYIKHNRSSWPRGMQPLWKQDLSRRIVAERYGRWRRLLHHLRPLEKRGEALVGLAMVEVVCVVLCVGFFVGGND